MEFLNKTFARLHLTHAAHAGCASFPFSWAAPWDGLIVWVAIEAASRGECHEGKGEEECDATIHSKI
jgi:hypothetical protein